MLAQSEISRFLLVGRTLARTAGAAAALRAIPLFGGIGLFAFILFSPQGMEARDVVRSARQFPALRLALWVAWLVAATPLARTLFSAPSAVFLRSLPIPRWHFLLPLGGWILALQAPFALLWGAGEGVASGLAAALTAAAAAALLVARPARRAEQAAAIAVALTIAAGPPAALAIAAALPALGVGIWAAWQRAREQAGGQARWIAGPAPLALALALGARLARAEIGLAIRGALVATLAGTLGAIGARNTDRLEPAAFGAFSLAVSAIPLTIAAGGIAGAVQRAETRVRWLLDTTGARGATRVAAAMGTVALAGALLGLTEVAASFAAGVPAGACLHAAPALALFGAALGAMSSDITRRAARRGKAGGGLVVGGLTVTALAALAAVLLMDPLAPLALALAAVALGAGSARTAGPAPPTPGAPLDPLDPLDPRDGGPDALQVQGVRKRFGGRWILDAVTFRWPGPGVLVLRGDNGAGKSTLLEIVAGVAAKDEGAITLAGASLEAERPRALAQIGYVPDAMDLPEHLTVEELSALVAALKRAPLPAKALIERLGVRPFFRDRLGALSLGQRRRACLLAALSGEPRLLILDEPTNGLDAEGHAMLAALLRERTARGCSALISTHERAFIEEVADASIHLAGGQIT